MEKRSKQADGQCVPLFFFYSAIYTLFTLYGCYLRIWDWPNIAFPSFHIKSLVSSASRTKRSNFFFCQGRAVTCSADGVGKSFRLRVLCRWIAQPKRWSSMMGTKKRICHSSARDLRLGSEIISLVWQMSTSICYLVLYYLEKRLWIPPQRELLLSEVWN